MRCSLNMAPKLPINSEVCLRNFSWSCARLRPVATLRDHKNLSSLAAVHMWLERKSPPADCAPRTTFILAGCSGARPPAARLCLPRVVINGVGFKSPRCWTLSLEPVTGQETHRQRHLRRDQINKQPVLFQYKQELYFLGRKSHARQELQLPLTRILASSHN